MSDFFKKFKNIILGKKDTEEIVDSIKDFNAITSTYVSVLQDQIKNKKKKITRVRVLVNKLIPQQKLEKSFNINIQLLDINSTKITEKGKGSYNTQMDWEKKFKDYQRGNKGTLI